MKFQIRKQAKLRMKNAEKRKYQVRGSECYNRECFIPFAGNGIKICRLYEMGQCPEKYKTEIKEKELLKERGYYGGTKNLRPESN